MARPPVEWPIPVYVTELRERVVATYRVPAAVLAQRVPAPVALELAGGHALVSLSLGNGRCLNSVGGLTLASEFHTAELVTPVRWQGACRPLLRGLYLLHLMTDSSSLSRLVRTALECEAGLGEQEQGAERARYTCSVRERGGAGELSLALPRPPVEEAWPLDSVFGSQEQAEGRLLHPECYFAADEERRVVRAFPVHQYARATTHVRPLEAAGDLVARLLSARPEEVTLDHVLFQKRCTHTWSFPPERILAVPRPVASRQWRSPVGSGSR